MFTLAMAKGIETAAPLAAPLYVSGLLFVLVLLGLISAGCGPPS